MHSDTPTKGIVAALREGGASVFYWEAVSRSKGVPDLIVGHAGKMYLLEVKSAKGVLSEHQQKWHAYWQGNPVAVVHNVAEAMAAIGMV